MNEISQDQYSKIVKSFTEKPFNLTNAWVLYQQEKGNNALFFVDDADQPQIICWARVKKVRFIGQVLDIEGPLYRPEVTVKKLHKFLEEIRALPYQGFFINLNTKYDVVFEEAVRKAMFKRPIGQSSTNLTIVVDTHNFKPSRNWKRNIKKAEKVDYKVKIENDLDLRTCEIIEQLHEENSKYKKLSYKLEAKHIEKLTNQEEVLTFLLYREGEPIAARIISLDNSVAHDVYACNSMISREDGATQFLMEEIFKYLKENDVRKFDFSRIPLGRKGAKGVYDFKHASGGIVEQYNGEWVFFKNTKVRHFYYFYNAIVNKKDFY